MCTIYRPPNCEAANFLPVLDKVREKLEDHKQSDIIISGDFNFPQVNWSDPDCRKISAATNDEKIQLNKLLNLTDDFFLQQLVTQPTRNDNILDLVFTNITDSLFDCTISKHKTLSDHNLIELKLNHNHSEPPIPEICTDNTTERNGYKKYNFHKADYEAINRELNDINWQSELDATAVSEQLNKFNDIVLNIISQHTPEIQIIRKHYKSKFYRERRALWRRRNRIQSSKLIKR